MTNVCCFGHLVRGTGSRRPQEDREGGSGATRGVTETGRAPSAPATPSASGVSPEAVVGPSAGPVWEEDGA